MFACQPTCCQSHTHDYITYLPWVEHPSKRFPQGVVVSGCTGVSPLSQRRTVWQRQNRIFKRSLFFGNPKPPVSVLVCGPKKKDMLWGRETVLPFFWAPQTVLKTTWCLGVFFSGGPVQGIHREPRNMPCFKEASDPVRDQPQEELEQ